MEVVEHVADPAAFIGELATRLASGGLMILSTPNRTTLSKLLLVEAAERIGAVPRGTHDWDRFLKRSEEHTSELQSLMRISYAVFCLKKKKHTQSQYTMTRATSITPLVHRNQK